MTSAGTILPAIGKPFDRMTIEELRAERAYWISMILVARAGSPFQLFASDCAFTCAGLIARRAAAAQAEPPNAIIGEAVSLSHRVPVLEADPVLKTK